MLGFILFYFIGKYFYKLAELYNEKKWLFAILGILVYFAGGLVGGFLLGILIILFDFSIDFENTILMAFIELPFGLGASYLFYYLLEKSWSKKQKSEELLIEDIGKSDNNHL